MLARLILYYLLFSLICWKYLFIYRYIFSTEGHLLPATPQISLIHEHCSYLGAYCKGGGIEQESRKSDISIHPQENNASVLSGSWVHSSYPSDSSFLESTSTSGLMKVSLPFVFSKSPACILILLLLSNKSYMIPCKDVLIDFTFS